MINRNKSYLLLLCLTFVASSLDAASWWQRARERGRKASQQALQKYSGLSRPARYVINAAMISGAAAMLATAIRYQRPDLYIKYRDQFASFSKELWGAIQERVSILLKKLKPTEHIHIFNPHDATDSVGVKLYKDALENNPADYHSMKEEILSCPNTRYHEFYKAMFEYIERNQK